MHRYLMIENRTFEFDLFQEFEFQSFGIYFLACKNIDQSNPSGSKIR